MAKNWILSKWQEMNQDKDIICFFCSYFSRQAYMSHQQSEFGSKNE